MNAFRFLWRTAPQAYFKHGVALVCVIASSFSGSVAAVLVVFGVWTLMLVNTAIGVMRHRHTLYVQRAERLVSWAFLNSYKYGYRTPSNLEGVAYLRASDRDPLTDPKILKPE